MTVFKGYMKIIGQNRMLILLYVAIFFGCTLLFQSTAGKSETSYQAEKMNIGIVDKDGGSLAESLTAVSYTHLDVYKRQVRNSRIEKF